MKTNFISILVAVLLISCGGGNSGGETPPDPPKPGGEKPIPAWNKRNTATVYLFSNFENKSLQKSNYFKISSFLKIHDFHIAVLNNSDVDLGKGFNGGVNVTSDLKLYSFYNLDSFEDQKVKGSTVILKTPVDELTTYAKTNTYISNVKTQFSGIEFPFSVVSIHTQEKLEATESLLNNVVSNKRVVFSTIKNSLVESLKNTVKKYSSTYRIQDYKTKNDYSIVIICPKYWLSRKVSLIEKISNTDIYKIQVEANVFY